jgi:hypothetical protein
VSSVASILVEEGVPFHTNALDIDTFHAINHATIDPLSRIPPHAA